MAIKRKATSPPPSLSTPFTKAARPRKGVVKDESSSPSPPPETKPPTTSSIPVKNHTSPSPATSSSSTTSAPSFRQAKYYPPEMSNERCQAYIDGRIPRPITALRKTLDSTLPARQKIPVGAAVVHWFKRDLRVHDNRALAAAWKLADENKVPLVGLYLVSPQDYEAHCTGRVRVDFELRSVGVLRGDLAGRDIPLHVEVVEMRKGVVGRVLEVVRGYGAKHVFCNMEYEVDELRREERLVRLGVEEGVSVEVLHDDTVVPPGILATGQGKQYAVYSPWFRAWCARVNAHPVLLEESPAPGRNPEGSREKFKKVFGMEVPEAPKEFALDEEEKERYGKLWPAGEHEALARLDKFLEARINKYKDTRNLPGMDTTTKLSPHLAAGTLSARTAVRLAREKSGTKKVDAGSEGIKTWISEVAWRDFYVHVMAWWPFVVMGKPFKFEMSKLDWPFDGELWQKWIDGKTGFPIVDAAMRQLKEMGWMHNRCRMIVASFLAKDLLIDWRHGEHWFAQHLIDHSPASNSGGWGFSASVGVDPQPYFRIFNPLLQSEKFDDSGEYLRKFIPELRNIKGKAIHDPYGRGAAKEAERAGYPKPCVVHSERRQKALALYKSL
ncbi:deoxyribodipyrimidine photo-lyase [Elsinoe ampelina]|uniref:Deoxyribodipyrimidine photo-lyase n=1 Tax=Elsinoe ampelina TaxID=302913 RepID=A0A6A6G7X3_9PEZI|nr:deoxyribodipyrimidine photo-lyase [Elsinoe ampelina]